MTVTAEDNINGGIFTTNLYSVYAEKRLKWDK